MPTTLPLDSLDFTKWIRPGDRVVWGQSSAEPEPLVRALLEQRSAIGRFSVFLGASFSGLVKPEHADSIAFSAYSGTGDNRALAAAGCLDILPLHYSQLGPAIASGRLKIDVLLLQLAPADEAGRYSVSMAQEYLVPAIAAARTIIAEVNDQAPWSHGERTLGDEDIDVIVRTSRAPFELKHPPAGEAEQRIASRVASMVEDGATVQFGIGAMPEAMLAALKYHRHLGIHGGVLSDALADLMEGGAVDNSRKGIDPGVSVGGIVFGSRRIQRFVDRNPAVQLRSSNYTHHPTVLGRVQRLAALNTAIEVDLTGQINAEVAANTYVGAVGGAVDFVRAAQACEGGLPVTALSSTAGKGERRVSKIVRRLSGPVSTPRADAGLIVTEFGAADLRGVSVSERAKRLIAIAHPDFREELERSAKG